MNWKKVLYYTPGVGLISHTANEIKKRRGKKPLYDLRKKEDLKALGSYLFQAGFAIISKVIIGAYIGTGISTGNWNPVDHVKNIFIEKKENKLEKTILFEDVNKNSTERFIN